MRVAIIPVESLEKAQLLLAHKAELYEFRLDYWPDLDITQIKYLQQQAQAPVLFTLRKREQGGFYAQDETIRFALIEKLIALNPDYLDLEFEVPLDFCQKLKKISPKTQLVRSYHNFIDTPENLTEILENMINPIFSVYKIITTAQSIVDTLRVLQFVKTHSKKHTLIAHAMGEVGEVSRILGKIFGNCWTYAGVSNEEHLAPGLLTLDELTTIYHYPQLNAQTKIYGLIGDPTRQSIGHIYHNNEFIKHHQNAVYVKFHVKDEELAEFFQRINDWPVEGLSVTMPHKQAVLKFCKQLTSEVQAIGATNTLIKKINGFLAANTDGDAVVKILPSNLENKKVILLGAGGAASSIIYSLIKAGAQVSVYNRTPEKLEQLAKKYPVKTFALSEIEQADYDILINTIPEKFYQNNLNLIKDKIILDANYQATPTRLICDAQKQGCICIDGHAMFYAQAAMQRDLWFKHHE